MNRIRYIEILKAEFVHRRSKNIFYSLRNFAKDLELNPMHLSNILNNKRGLSRRKAEIVAGKLRHLNFSERRRFLLLVSATSARSRFERNLAKMGLKNQQVGQRSF
ncbi:hypothetical protein [Pseudobdellovibrio sp. HCB154]|uniref:hypothetical protein n=1 Tax=Pseudobdellovibrio sp. HCB154 TaxID=3386277 RepID=UPI003916F3EC